MSPGRSMCLGWFLDGSWIAAGSLPPFCPIWTEWVNKVLLTGHRYRSRYGCHDVCHNRCSTTIIYIEYMVMQVPSRFPCRLDRNDMYIHTWAMTHSPRQLIFLSQGVPAQELALDSRLLGLASTSTGRYGPANTTPLTFEHSTAYRHKLICCPTQLITPSKFFLHKTTHNLLTGPSLLSTNQLQTSHSATTQSHRRNDQFSYRTVLPWEHCTDTQGYKPQRIKGKSRTNGVGADSAHHLD
jgi:hypothetical protein